ncbi:MAG: hypothetical protein ACR2G7_11850 [Acidimicrobiales bacterium]
MTMTGWRLRQLVTAGVLVALLLGTFWGQDDHFPFGPFLMFSGAAEVDGVVRAAQLQATTSDGAQLHLQATEVGLRRAELEGQIPRFQTQPSLLGHLAESYRRRHPGGPVLVEVRMVEVGQQLSGGRPVGDEEERVLSRWRKR